MLTLIPLGGLGEIGLNALVLETGSERLLVDAGLMFPSATQPGVEVVLPDFAYLLEAPEKLTGVLLTHGHEDHVGALAPLLRRMPVPVYGGAYTLGVARRKLEESEVVTELRTIGPGERFRLGEGFGIEPIRVCHSTPDALGYAIDTPEGRVVHTGDFTIDETPWEGRTTDLDRLGALGDEGVLCLLSDSTNAEVEGHTGSEQTVTEGFERVFESSHQRLVVALFASHIPRIGALLALAERHGRRVVLVGRSMLRTVDLAVSLGHLRIPEGLLATVEQAASLPRERTLVLTTGAQAEPRAGLAQLASGELGGISLAPGDHVVFSARAIPGNERAVGDLINRLVLRGAQVSHAANAPGLHVSGHASRAQQRRMLEVVRPRHFVPVHGEARQLHRHLELARETGVPAEGLLLATDGDVLQFEGGKGRFSGTTPVGRRYLGRFRTGELTEASIRERRSLAESGVVVATVVIDRETGALLTGPKLSGRGLAQEEVALLPLAVNPVREQFLTLAPSLRADTALAEETLALAVRRVFRDKLGWRPSVLPQLVKL